MSSKIKFEKLTPVTNADLKTYNQAFTHVFANSDIKNVAITGAYGAGKSSVLESYKREQEESKAKILKEILTTPISLEKILGLFKRTPRFISVTLANFEIIDKSPNDVDEPILEGKIINQLIHQISPRRIPATKFRVKRKTSLFIHLMNTLIILSFMILMLYLTEFNLWSTFLGTVESSIIIKLLSKTLNWEYRLIGGLLQVVILFYWIFSIVRFQIEQKALRKLSIQGADFEIFDGENSTLFDKHLNEVLYIFRRSNADVIVFEDMDRFNDNQIFQKLREINFLVNQSSKRTIRFFYLIRDDVFATKDRTKFFDFILPIVPVIDSRNSYDKLVKLFNESDDDVCKFEDPEDKKFLQELTLFIDDLRILKNIYNEFAIYYSKISSLEQNKYKLLSIISYKNLFPKDFVDLQHNKGYVYDLFLRKNDLINEQLNEIEGAINDIDQQLSDSSEEHLRSVNELDLIYLPKINTFSLSSGHNQTNYTSLLEFIGAIKEGLDDESNVFVRMNGNKINHQEYSELLNQNEMYKRRLRSLDNKGKYNVERLNEAKRELFIKKNILEYERLQDLLTKGNREKYFKEQSSNKEDPDYGEIKSNQYFPLIKFLIIRGFIDETYPDYLSFFSVGKMSPMDKNFLISLAERDPKKYTYPLNEPRIVIEHLTEGDFNREAILNNSLLDYLLQVKHDSLKYLILLLKESMNFDFIYQYIFIHKQEEFDIKSHHLKNAQSVLFINMLNEIWPSFLKDFDQDLTLEEESLRNIRFRMFVFLIFNLDFESVARIDTICNIGEMISSKATFLGKDLESSYIPKIDIFKRGMKLLNVNFDFIEVDDANRKLLQAVYENDLYKINGPMISTILEHFYKIPVTSEYNYSNLTLIWSEPNSPLSKYINANISEYMNVLWGLCSNRIDDDEMTVVQLINHPDVRIEDKLQYVDMWTKKITHLSEIEYTSESSVIYEKLIKQGKAKLTLENVFNCYMNNEYKLSNLLIQFINYETIRSLFEDLEVEPYLTVKELNEFVKQCLKSGELNDIHIIPLLKNSTFSIESDAVSGYPIRYYKYLLCENVIEMNKDNLLEMRDLAEDYYLEYIEKNAIEYVNLVIDEELYLQDEILLILENKIIESSLMLRLLKKYDDTVSVDLAYTDEIFLSIINHHFNEDDFPKVISYFNVSQMDTKGKILEFILKNTSIFIQQELEIEEALFEDIINNSDQDIDVLKDLLNQYLRQPNSIFEKYISNSDQELLKRKLRSYLLKVELEPVAKAMNGTQRQKIDYAENNEQILGILKENHLIRKITEDENYLKITAMPKEKEKKVRLPEEI